MIQMPCHRPKILDAVESAVFSPRGYQSIKEVLVAEMPCHRPKLVNAVCHLIRPAPVCKVRWVEEDVRRGQLSPPSCVVEREAVMLSRMASHSLDGYRAAEAVLLPRGPLPRSC